MNFPQNGFPQYPGQFQAPQPTPTAPGFPPQGYGAPAPGGMPMGYHPGMAPQGGGYDPMSAVYAGIAGAAVTTNGVYLEPGFYELRIEKSFLNNGHNGQNFIVEATVMKAAPNDPNHLAKYPPGSKVSWTCNLTKHESAKGNVKGFIAAMLGIPASEKHRMDSELTPAVVMNAMTSNPFGGLIVHCQTAHKPTRPTPQKPQGGVYTAHTWTSTGMKDPTWTPGGAAPVGGAPMGAPSVPGAFTPPQGPASPAPASFPTPGTMVPPAGQFGAPQGWGQPPAAPPAIPPAPAAFPPPGWQAHPNGGGWFFHETTREVVDEATLRARGA